MAGSQKIRWLSSQPVLGNFLRRHRLPWKENNKCLSSKAKSSGQFEWRSLLNNLTCLNLPPKKTFFHDLSTNKITQPFFSFPFPPRCSMQLPPPPQVSLSGTWGKRRKVLMKCPGLLSTSMAPLQGLIGDEPLSEKKTWLSDLVVFHQPIWKK